MRRLIQWLILGLLIACMGLATADRPAHRFGERSPQPRRPDTIRVATYNVLNLFDGLDDPSLSGDQDDLDMATDLPRCRGLAKVIRSIDADVLALQEVESEACLRSFRDTFLKGMGYEYIASIDPGYNRGIECSVLSRIPIVNASLTPQLRIDRVRRTGVGWTQVADKDQARVFQRSPLSVDLRSEDGYEFTLFIVHHKAGRSKENDFQREAEALKLVELLQAASAGGPGRNIIVLGDFNCAPWAKSFRTYLQAGMIDAMAHRTTYKDNPDTPLYRTHESDRVLDYILLNSAAHRELVIGSQHVYGVKSPPASFDWKKDKRSPEAPSDHYPLIIDLMTSDQP